MDDIENNGVEKNDKQKQLHDYVVLQSGLLDNSIKPKDFLNRLMDFDQAETTHINAKANAELLERPAIKNFIESTNNPEVIFQYLDNLGLYYFHYGQSLALNGDNEAAHTLEAACLKRKEALDYILQLRESGNEGGIDNIKQHIEFGRKDLLYTQATAAYMKGDVKEVQSVYGQMKSLSEKSEEDMNIRIVSSLLSGLRSRGKPNYAKDYYLK